jgi:RNA polymerase sigma factor (sigma-70 family)
LKVLEQIVSDCKKGDRIAQGNLFDLYAPKMLGVCIRYFHSRTEAEDILQEGFIKVFTKIKSYKGEGAFEGWMKRIFINTALEQIRKKKNMYVVSDFEQVAHEHYTDDLVNNLDTSILLKLIDALPIGYRTVFNLYAIEGYPHKEIAELLEISEGTSKSQLSRARALLQHQLQNYSEKKYTDAC